MEYTSQFMQVLDELRRLNQKIDQLIEATNRSTSSIGELVEIERKEQTNQLAKPSQTPQPENTDIDDYTSSYAE